MFTRLDYSSALEYSIIRRYTNIVYYYCILLKKLYIYIYTHIIYILHTYYITSIIYNIFFGWWVYVRAVFGTGGICPGVYARGVFVRGVFVRGYLSGGICPGVFVLDPLFLTHTQIVSYKILTLFGSYSPFLFIYLFCL